MNSDGHEQQTSDVIEITPQMLKAGLDEFLDCDLDDLACTNPRLLVRSIFEAMMRACEQYPYGGVR